MTVRLWSGSTRTRRAALQPDGFLFARSLAGSATPALAHAGGAKPVKEPRLTEPTTPAPATTPAPTPTPTTTSPPEVTFSAEQQVVIDRRIAAARRNAEEEAKNAVAAAATAAEAAAAEAARLTAEEAKGNYDAAKAIIEQEREAAKAEAATNKERLDTAIAAIKPGVDTRWTDLPEEAKAFFEGADDDVLAKAAFLDKSAALVAKLTTTPAQRVGLTPRPSTKPEDNDEEAKRAQARSYKDF